MSVGETVSIFPVIDGLTELAPTETLLVTTGTVTAARLLEHRVPAVCRNGKLLHRFAPMDVPRWVERFLDHWRPTVACFVESELWPNILLECRDRRIPILLLNGRMSIRSLRLWSLVPETARTVLSSFTRIHARGARDAERFRSLGANNVFVAGDLKLSSPVLPSDDEILRETRGTLAGRPVFLAASTHPGEEELIRIVHDSLLRTHPRLLTIVVPRHPERGAELAKLLSAPRRQLGQAPPAQGIWVADTLGELGIWYRVCDVTFVGGSLVRPGGGHNPLEPARIGRPVVMGPHTENFLDQVALLRGAGGMEVANDAEELRHVIGELLSNSIHRSRMGERARIAVIGFDGLVHETAVEIVNSLASA